MALKESQSTPLQEKLKKTWKGKVFVWEAFKGKKKNFSMLVPLDVSQGSTAHLEESAICLLLPTWANRCTRLLIISVIDGKKSLPSLSPRKHGKVSQFWICVNAFVLCIHVYIFYPWSIVRLKGKCLSLKVVVCTTSLQRYEQPAADLHSLNNMLRNLRT